MEQDLRIGVALSATQMAESSEQHSAEDLVPIQNFMRRFSHVDNHQELNRLSLEAAAAAAAAKEPSRNDPTS